MTLTEGRKLYEEHASRAKITGGTRKSTQKRYRAVLDKFIAFLQSKGLASWNRVNSNVLEQYLSHLQAIGYAYRTQYFEGTTVKQIINVFITKKRLPADLRITLSLPKPQGTDTYCWRQEEVVAIREFSLADPKLRWLYDVVSTLTFTGLRIGELIHLRWNDIDFAKGASGTIRLVDESTSRQRTDRVARTLKGGRGRSFPINPELRPIMEAIDRHSDGYVFHGPRNFRLKADTIRNILIRDVLKPLAAQFPTAEGDIGFADGRLHSFRHFFCSLCANNNVPQQMVMQWLGHQDSKLVAHYYHLHDDEAQRHMQKIKLTSGKIPIVSEQDAE